MILIGERINGMFSDVKQAIADKNKQVVQELAKKQTEAGALSAGRFIVSFNHRGHRVENILKIIEEKTRFILNNISYLN